METDSEYLVHALLPLRLRSLSTEEQRLRGAAAGPLVDLPSPRRRPDAPDSLEELVERVASLERKIDVLTELLLRREQQEAQRSAVDVELGMAGFTFDWPAALQTDEVIEIELILGLMPATTLRCVAHVLSCEPVTTEEEGETPSLYRVTARFDELADAEADALHRYMLTVQRRARRSRTTARMSDDAGKTEGEAAG